MAQTYGYVPLSYPNMAADLDVNTDNKLTATNTTTYLFGVLKISGGNKYADINEAAGSIFGHPGRLSRAATAYKAMENQGYDVVVASNYRTTKTVGFLHLWVTYKTTMTGYGAKITSLKMADTESKYDSDSIEYTSTEEDIQIAKEAKKAGTVPKANRIFLTDNLELFENGSIKAVTDKEKKQYESEFIEEIESNIKDSKSIDEYEFIRTKVNALEAYNQSLDKPKKSITSLVRDFNETIDKKIEKLSGSKASKKK